MVALRCGILLEAYCRGLPLDGLHSIVKQVAALEKLEKLTDVLKEHKDETQRDRNQLLSNYLKQTDYLEALQELPNPLNNNLVLGNILVEECQQLDSAKRPLWLVWSNPDPMSYVSCPTNAIIFKTGDDLTSRYVDITSDSYNGSDLEARELGSKNASVHMSGHWKTRRND